MINSHRLQLRIEEMATIGETQDKGNTRLALSSEDKEARELLIGWMNEIGLDVKIDDFGNIYGRKDGTNPNLSPIILGSHIDTVPNGGNFDGVLGVLGALEALETLSEEQKEHERSIEILSFTNEEGARFTPQMLGSGAVTGNFSKDYTYNRTDANGLKFMDELRKINFLGEKENRLQDAHSFIELHIEQGPILEKENKSIGIVEGIAGFSWFEITMKGESNHSSTTPMEMRKDSLTAATSTIQKLNEWAINKKDGTVLTVGKIHTKPGAMNVIPKETVFTIDVRIHNKKDFDIYLNEIKQIITQTSEEHSISSNLQNIRTQEPIKFSRELIGLMENVCKRHHLSNRRITSGAGHDAMYMNAVTDTAMIFVPSMNGISHSPKEHTTIHDIENGVNVLYEMIRALAR